jgi:hypothetical protein
MARPHASAQIISLEQNIYIMANWFAGLMTCKKRFVENAVGEPFSELEIAAER